MRRYWMMALLAVCLLLPALTGAARAADSGTYTVNGTFCYQDLEDGAWKPIPDGTVILTLRNGDGSLSGSEYRGTVSNGVVTFPLPSGTVTEGDYHVHLSLAGTVSCGGEAEVYLSQDRRPLGEIHVALQLFIPFGVKDGTTGEPVTDYTCTLETESGSGSVVRPNSNYLALPWARCRLTLAAQGYQETVCEVNPAIGRGGLVLPDGVGDTAALRMFTVGTLVQPIPTDVSYRGGVVSWSNRFLVPEGDTTNYVRWCCIEVTNYAANETLTYRQSYSSCDIFREEPDWPDGDCVAKITTLAQPYYTTHDSEPVFFRFYYARPTELPAPAEPAWVADRFPAMTWKYSALQQSFVKEFRVTPRVADSPNGRERDFVHEYLPDWEGSFRFVRSGNGIYEAPGLTEAIKAYGEGWYSFDVSAVSGSEEWRDSSVVYTSAPFHYVPDAGESVQNGTMTAMSGAGAVKWTLDSQSGALTVSEAPQGQGTVFAASYGADGRFLGIQAVQENRPLNVSRAGRVRMFWLENGTFKPMARASNVVSRPEG